MFRSAPSRQRPHGQPRHRNRWPNRSRRRARPARRPSAVRAWPPASARNCAARLRAACRLVEQPGPSARVWSAPSTIRPGCCAATATALSRASSAATSPGPVRPDCAGSPARRYRPESPRRRCRHWPATSAAHGSARPGSGVWAAPERHSESRCRCRSASSFITAAAVSSIERRVTSSSAQLNLALSRRAKVTSSATAWRSM